MRALAFIEPLTVMTEGSQGVPFTCLHIDRRAHPWRCARALRRQLEELKPSIVHVHSFFGLLMERIAFPVHRPYRLVATLHNQGYLSWPAKTVYEKFRKRLHGWLLRHANQVTAVSDAVINHYRNQFSLGDVALIPNPLPSDVEARMGSCTEFETTAWPPRRIVIPGRFTREKGHRYALDALALLKGQSLDVTLEILGDGPLFEDLSAQVTRIGLEDIVTFTLAPSREAFLDRIQAADLCLLPSVSEGFGIVALEAMALGIPVLASEQGGLAEIICHGENGWLAPPADAQTLATQLDALIMEKQAASEIAFEARNTARSYSIDLVGEKWRSVYSRLNSAELKR